MTQMTITNDTALRTWPSGQVGQVHLASTTRAVAGQYATWVLEYEAGPYGADDGGGLKFLLPIPSDRGIAQFEDPTAPNYVSVRNSGTARVSARWQTKAHIRPWVKGVVVDISDGALAPGDVVTLTWGDTSQGSPGARVQSYAESSSPVKMVADIFATGIYYEVPGETGSPVHPDSTDRLVAIARNDPQRPGQGTVTLRAIDRYGNVNTAHTGGYSLEDGDGTELHGEFTAQDNGIVQISITLAQDHEATRFTVTDDQGLRYSSNPLLEHKKGDLLMWGDTQGQTGETVGAGSLNEFFRYARNAAGLDFVTHSANDFQVENDAYAQVLQAADDYTDRGQFVAFAGYEWSGNTPVGGDHNVLFTNNGNAPLHRSSHALVEDLSDVDTGARTTNDLYRSLEEADADFLTVAHVGGRVANLDLIEAAHTPVLEVTSVHGWFEWFAMEALRKGLVVGLVAASDDHSGRPGGSFPSLPVFGVRSGLAAVRGSDVTRTGIMSGLRRRDCYATTGERMIVDATADGHRMGEVFTAAAAPVIMVSASGTAPVERIEIMTPEEGVVATWAPVPADNRTKLRISWRGARDRNRARVQDWSGSLQVNGARIISARTWSFDHPDQGITSQSETELSWVSTTNGDHDGIEIELDREPGTIEFTTTDCQLAIDVSQLEHGPYEHRLDAGVDRAVRLERLHTEPLPLDASTEFRDLPWKDGRNIFLVRIMQADGHLAWTSPFFVDSQSTR